MISFTLLLERIVQKLCDWLYDSISGNHSLAWVGNGIAGLPATQLLPIDRRLRVDSVMTSGNVVEKAKKSETKTGHASNTRDCGFWAYCHMLGRPCRRCGGYNHVLWPHPKAREFSFMGSKFCPPGTAGGAAWYGCCRHPGGKVKYIAFLDCCGSMPGQCGSLTFCTNWPAAKNWCAGSGSYYCTIAIDIANDAGCQ